jgi:hypothetical protein
MVNRKIVLENKDPSSPNDPCASSRYNQHLPHVLVCATFPLYFYHQRKMIYCISVFLVICAAVNGKIYFKEGFNDAAWEKRWVVPSDWKPEVRGMRTRNP